MNKSVRSARSRSDAPPSVLWRVLRTAHELEARLETALAQIGLSLAKVGVLRALAEAEEPLTLSDVAERVRCVRSNITQLVDRLEADGLVRRVNDPHDRRIRRASLTPTGRSSCTEGIRVMAIQERETASALSPVDAVALARALGHLAP